MKSRTGTPTADEHGEQVASPLPYVHTKAVLQLVWLDAARLAATCAVVLLHVAATVVAERQVGGAEWWCGNVYDSMTRWCVPVFVMISGALLLGNNKKETLYLFYRRRAERVLVPLLVWTVAYTFWSQDAAAFSLTHLRAAEIARAVVTGRPHYHMWFLFMMVGLYAFTPFVRVLVSNVTRNELKVFVALLFLLSAANELAGAFRRTPLFLIEFLPYVPYFLCGHIIASSAKRISTATSLAMWGASFVLTAVGCYVVASRAGVVNGLYVYSYSSITVIPMSIASMCLFRSLSFDERLRTPFKRLSALSLGVYLVHPLLLETFRRFMFKQEGHSPLVSVPIIAALVVVLSFLVASIAEKIPYVRRAI